MNTLIFSKYHESSESHLNDFLLNWEVNIYPGEEETEAGLVIKLEDCLPDVANKSVDVGGLKVECEKLLVLNQRIVIRNPRPLVKSRTVYVLYSADENEAIIRGNKWNDLGIQTCLLKTINKPGAFEVIPSRRVERVPASQAQ